MELSGFPANATLPASDLSRARRWYEEKLDLTAVEEWDTEVRYRVPGYKTVNGIADFPGERGAWFKDSEGNLLALGESLGA
jgi:catechol-2,3-dioxygenase